MRFAVVAVVVGLAVLFVAGGLRDRGHAQALSGCCKERATPEQPWQANGMSFRECRAVNDREDGDDVFERVGLYWWDRQCQT